MFNGLKRKIPLKCITVRLSKSFGLKIRDNFRAQSCTDKLYIYPLICVTSLPSQSKISLFQNASMCKCDLHLTVYYPNTYHNASPIRATISPLFVKITLIFSKSMRFICILKKHVSFGNQDMVILINAVIWQLTKSKWSKVYTALVIDITVFWDMISCWLVICYQCFNRLCFPHQQSSEKSMLC